MHSLAGVFAPRRWNLSRKNVDSGGTGKPGNPKRNRLIHCSTWTQSDWKHWYDFFCQSWGFITSSFVSFSSQLFRKCSALPGCAYCLLCSVRSYLFHLFYLYLDIKQSKRGTLLLQNLWLNSLQNPAALLHVNISNLGLKLICLQIIDV